MRGKIRDDSERRRLRRTLSNRKRIEGTKERPRLAVARSLKHISAQLIDDITGTTLVAASTQGKEIAAELKGKKKSQQAELIGKKLAELSKQKGIEAVVFDRRGRPFHGRIAALAKGAREAGLKF
jgi:large subunit ribosomal protein L18